MDKLDGRITQKSDCVRGFVMSYNRPHKTQIVHQLARSGTTITAFSVCESVVPGGLGVGLGEMFVENTENMFHINWFREIFLNSRIE
jgi:hypothetical protein